jgi:hypothetical protein
MSEGPTQTSGGSFREAPAAGQPRPKQPQAEETSRISRETGITIQFLRLVNESTGTRDLVRAVATFFHQQSGCDAVGVRLQEGEDSPDLEEPGRPSR